MGSYKTEFDKWARRYKERVYPRLSDVLPGVTPGSGADLQAGDAVMFTNDYGVTFGPYAVLGFCEPWHGRCVYFDHESYWFPARPDQVELTTAQFPARTEQSKPTAARHGKQEHIYRVAFKEPPIQGDSRTEFFFHSLSAIYGVFTAEQVGCKVSRLWNVGVSNGAVYDGRLCRITKEPISRKKRGKPK